jgi:UDP-N-acetylglucosamine--N-acetylmuramyl-(pentapeptide) pyrophosphoryl-undecaprenol N-acetylglucosamine transferase
MTILLIGGGSGGHITPLLAVARELKLLKPDLNLVAICEHNSKFVHLYEQEPAIDTVQTISAGKYRRYSGLSMKDRVTDVGTWARNARDIGRTAKGYLEAKKLLKTLQPSAILIKGGFVAVPVGKAAAALAIPYLTHDSDSTPGLANRLIAKKASFHATGMPAELYAYPKDRTVFTGIPIASEFHKISDTEKAALRQAAGLQSSKKVVMITGGSQGGEQLNRDMVHVAARLMQRQAEVGIIHIAGSAHEQAIKRAYDNELLADERRRVVVKGFINDLFTYSGAADIIVTRGGANAIAEFAVQAKPIIVVPGKLAGAHQDKNAAYLKSQGAAEVAVFGDSEDLFKAVQDLLNDPSKQKSLANKLHEFAKPNAAQELAELTLRLAEKQG